MGGRLTRISGRRVSPGITTKFAILIVICIIVLAGIAVYAYNTYVAPEQPKVVKKTIKVAAIYTTPLEEPWNTVLHEALLNAKDELGIEYSYIENVAQSDFERVARQYIEAGYDIIFAHSYNFYQDTIKLAKEFKDVCFAQGSGPINIEWPKNVVLYDYWLQDAAFLAGVTAGLLTKSDHIGIVTAFPVTDVNALVNAFIAGAKYVNPDIRVSVVFIQSWFDPQKAKEAANAMIREGADFIYAERYGVFDAVAEAQKNGLEVYAFGNIVDQKDLSPETVLASVVWDLRDFVKYLINEKMAGNWPGGIITEFKGWSKLVWNDKLRDKVVPPEIYEQIKSIESQINQGTLKVPVYTDWVPERWQ